jgi:hypothetical protein
MELLLWVTLFLAAGYIAILDPHSGRKPPKHPG